VSAFTNYIAAFAALRRCLILPGHCQDVVVHVNRHVLFLQARELKVHVDVIRVLVVMNVHPIGTVSMSFGKCARTGESAPWPEYFVLYSMYTMGSSGIERIIEEAIKCSEATEGIVGEVSSKRHVRRLGWVWWLIECCVLEKLSSCWFERRLRVFIPVQRLREVSTTFSTALPFLASGGASKFLGHSTKVLEDRQ